MFNESLDEHIEIAVEEVYSSFGLILYLLYILSKVAECKNVLYLDEVGFLEDFEDKLQDNQNSE